MDSWFRSIVVCVFTLSAFGIVQPAIVAAEEDTCREECAIHTDCGRRVCDWGCCRDRRPEDRGSEWLQSSMITFAGHEELTVEGANKLSPKLLEVLNEEAKKTKEQVRHSPYDDYHTNNLAVWSAVLGQRWVDFMGFKIGPSLFKAQRLCWDAVVQLPDDVQYDHFLRKFVDIGDKGFKDAVAGSTDRLRNYFLAAVSMEDEIIEAGDGGGTRVDFKVMKRFFFFGRALHLLQDSFSPVHSERVSKDGYQKVHNMFSYVCTAGAPQHPHFEPSKCQQADSLRENDCYRNSRNPLKPQAVKAMEATTDLWTAFLTSIRIVDKQKRQQYAEMQIRSLISKWFQVDKPQMAIPAPLYSCESVQTILTRRELCLDWTGRDSTEEKRPPYNWKGKGFGFSIK